MVSWRAAEPTATSPRVCQCAEIAITARGAVIYNATQSNKILAVIDFGADKTSTNGTFTVQLPAAGASAILTIA